ncbi:MAG TPA: UvrD-helicase domain-containing protein, partial [Crocinitomicaceae bacterium]|nr:UvrD-helicase domain-containing protein [Crocinitomicaceae bacterium]
MNTQKPLLIYSASAGSGKTYTLVKTYLELILKGDTNPLNFAKIMAMTFTNKAALEMKTRIIDALADLSNPNRHKTEKGKAKAEKYLADISKEFELQPEETQRKAQLALTHILHQYEDFYVMTIDK